MKVFKYLVALADISVGFLGLFFVIFAVTKPSATAVTDKQRLQQTVQRLREEIRQLEEIRLAKAKAGQTLPNGQTAKIIIARQGLTVEIAGDDNRARPRQIRFATADEFAAAAPQWRWPAAVVLYVDHRVPFEQVVNVIDALKSTNNDITVQIAALAK